MKHELLLGDYRQVLQNIKPDLILCSPPYNIGSKSPKKITKRKYGGYDSKSWGAIEKYKDNIPQELYEQQQMDFLIWALNTIKDNGVIIYNHKPRHNKGKLIVPYRWILPLEQENKLVIREEIVWDYKSTCNHTKSYVYNHTERLYVLHKPNAKIYFKNQDYYWANQNKGVSDVWRIPRASCGELKSNATMPLKIARQAIRLWSKPNSLVCDPYSGSGTTMIASYLEGRNFIGSEIEQGDGFYNTAQKRFNLYKKKEDAA